MNNKAPKVCENCQATDFDRSIDSVEESTATMLCECTECGHEWLEEWIFLQEV